MASLRLLHLLVCPVSQTQTHAETHTDTLTHTSTPPHKKKSPPQKNSGKLTECAPRGSEQPIATVSCQVGSAIPLRACYVMPGTDLAYCIVSLRPRYAMSGTELAYGATSARAVRSHDRGTRSLSSYALLLCDVMYWHHR
eukprot:2664730-Rhodomonas_salina.3